jgi:RND family efflux transporter MFP subunit
MLFFALGAVLVLGGGAAYVAQSSASAKPAGDGKPENAPVTLEFAASDIAVVALQPLVRTILISGSLAPVTQATVKSTVAGEVRRVLVREGDVVHAGDVLAEVDTVDARSRLAAARADLEERKTRLAIASRNRDTNQALLKQNFISQNAFEQLHSTFEGSEAAVKGGEAQVQLAQKAVDDAVVRAPISGVVSKQFVRAGERVGPDGPVMGLVDLSHMELEATVPASDVPSVSAGQTVRFQVDGFGTRSFQGRIERINPLAESSSRSIKIFVSVRNVDGSLRGGMFAQGQVMLAQSRSVPVIPASALFEEAGQTYAFAVVNGKLSKRAVKAGLRDDSSGVVEALEGLKTGEAVVRVRMNGLKDDAPATLLPNATKPS